MNLDSGVRYCLTYDCMIQLCMPMLPVCVGHFSASSWSSVIYRHLSWYSPLSCQTFGCSWCRS